MKKVTGPRTRSGTLWSETHSVLSDSMWPHRLYSPWNSPGQNTGMDSCSFLQGIFPTQGQNPGPSHCRQILYQLSYQGLYIISKNFFKSHNKGHTFPGIGGGVGLVTKSCPTLATSWTGACQPPLSMGFSKQEYWSGLPVPSPGDLLGPGVESRPPALQGDSLPTELRGKPFQGLWRPTKEGLRLCSVARNLPAMQEVSVDTDSVPGLKIPRRKKWKLLQHSWRETSMDRWVWWPTVQSVAKSQAWLGTWRQRPAQHAWKRKEDSRGW